MKKQTSFAKACGRPEFDWNKFLNGKNFSLVSLREANELAKSWVTCAVGEQCSIIPRSEISNGPDDEELYTLGILFSMSIEKMMRDYHFKTFAEHVKNAKITLDRIEVRSS